MEEKKNEIIKTEAEGEILPSVESLILNIRGQQVMLDRDLAQLYGVETRRLNEQVKRNIERFPEDFMFQLTKEEVSILKSQNATSSWGGTRKPSYALIEIRLDLDRHNAQYAPIAVATATNFHDRFLIIDDTVYHIGASLKDLGKKVFGFTKMELLTPNELLSKIKI